MDWLPLKGLGSGWVCTLKDGVVNQSGAMNTLRFVDETEICTEDLLEGPEAFGTGDGDVGFLGWVVSVRGNPDGREFARRAERGMKFGLSHVIHREKEGAETFALFIEGIGSDSELQAFA